MSAELSDAGVTVAGPLGEMSLAPPEQDMLEGLLQALNRDINCLSDDNRATRKRALKKLSRELSKDISRNVLQVRLQ